MGGVALACVDEVTFRSECALLTRELGLEGRGWRWEARQEGSRGAWLGSTGNRDGPWSLTVGKQAGQDGSPIVTIRDTTSLTHTGEGPRCLLSPLWLTGSGCSLLPRCRQQLWAKERAPALCFSPGSDADLLCDLG